MSHLCLGEQGVSKITNSLTWMELVLWSNLEVFNIFLFFLFFSIFFFFLPSFLLQDTNAFMLPKLDLLWKKSRRKFMLQIPHSLSQSELLFNFTIDFYFFTFSSFSILISSTPLLVCWVFPTLSFSSTFFKTIVGCYCCWISTTVISNSC